MAGWWQLLLILLTKRIVAVYFILIACYTCSWVGGGVCCVNTAAWTLSSCLEVYSLMLVIVIENYISSYILLSILLERVAWVLRWGGLSWGAGLSWLRLLLVEHWLGVKRWSLLWTTIWSSLALWLTTWLRTLTALTTSSACCLIACSSTISKIIVAYNATTLPLTFTIIVWTFIGRDC